MKKLILIFCLICPTCVHAQNVSESEIQVYANQWLRKNPVVVRYQEKQIFSLEINSIEIFQLRELHIPFYLVRLHPQGFIVMNSDRRLKPVLYFSFSGDVNLEDREDNAFYHLLLIQSEKNTQWISSALSSTPSFPDWNV
ncbi:MAG: hypothetical protein GY774_10130 [Planctomycetes bacterium]|nr:hypothetical protein [Planctomycetota bacterium]